MDTSGCGGRGRGYPISHEWSGGGKVRRDKKTTSVEWRELRPRPQHSLGLFYQLLITANLFSSSEALITNRQKWLIGPRTGGFGDKNWPYCNGKQGGIGVREAMKCSIASSS